MQAGLALHIPQKQPVIGAVGYTRHDSADSITYIRGVPNAVEYWPIA